MVNAKENFIDILGTDCRAVEETGNNGRYSI